MKEVESQGLIWDYYKPRHTHSWNMLHLAAKHLSETKSAGFEAEYAWENLIIRLAMYRNVVKTLAQLDSVKQQAIEIINQFDSTFEQKGQNALIALRNMFEHFDEYAAGKGRGPAERDVDLDPWRTITVEEYKRGKYKLELTQSMHAATTLRNGAKGVSDAFIQWYKKESAVG